MTETYSFSCSQCGGEWTSAYEVREQTVSAAHQRRVFYLDGFPVAPPRFGVACRACGGYGVRIARQDQVA